MSSFPLIILLTSLVSGHPSSEFNPLISAKCEKDSLFIDLLTEEPFVGIIHARGFRQKASCSTLGNGTKSTKLVLPLFVTPEDERFCGLSTVNKDSNEDKMVIIAVRIHKEIELKEDRFYSIRCSLASSSFQTKDKLTSRISLSVFHPESTQKRKDLLYGEGALLEARMSPVDKGVDFYLFNCLAFWEDQELLLSDDFGCPTEADLLTQFLYDSDTKAAKANLSSVFKFPKSNRVSFQCYVDICTDRCPSYGCGYKRPTSTKRPDNDLITQTSILVRDYKDYLELSRVQECHEYPWMTTLLIILAILLLIMFTVNLCLCSSLSCVCTKTQIEDKDSVSGVDYDDYDPYKLDYGPPQSTYSKY